MELELSEKMRTLSEIKQELEINGTCYGMDLTAHAFTNISDRLAELASKHPVIYSDVFSPNEQSRALLWPNNLRAFIISMLASAYEKNHFEEKSSKSNGKEYHYNVEIKKWSNDKEVLIFTAIIESNVVKTGYFNWSDRRK